jgi:multicomponent Na+:H+ antiporter subunit D
MPPLSGFFAKLALVQAGLDIEAYTIVGIALAVGLLTLLSMTKIWTEAFWKPAPDHAAGEPAPGPRWNALLLPIGALAAVTIAIGLGAEPLFSLATRAADQLLDRDAYITAVMGKRT